MVESVEHMNRARTFLMQFLRKRSDLGKYFAPKIVLNNVSRELNFGVYQFDEVEPSSQQK